MLTDSLQFDAARHEYTVAGVVVPSVTQVLELTGVSDYWSIPESTRLKALARGSAVHTLTQYSDEDDLDESSVNPEWAGYLRAWQSFRVAEEFRPDRIEYRVFHHQWRYAGTLDRTGKAAGKTTVLLDIKTGTAAKWVRLQLAAYAGCLENPRTYQRWCVELHEDGTFAVFKFRAAEWQADFNDWLYLLAALQVKRKYEGGL